MWPPRLAGLQPVIEVLGIPKSTLGDRTRVAELGEGGGVLHFQRLHESKRAGGPGRQKKNQGGPMRVDSLRNGSMAATDRRLEAIKGKRVRPCMNI